MIHVPYIFWGVWKVASKALLPRTRAKVNHVWDFWVMLHCSRYSLFGLFINISRTLFCCINIIVLHNQEMVLISVELVSSFLNIVWASIMRMSPFFLYQWGQSGKWFRFCFRCIALCKLYKQRPGIWQYFYFDTIWVHIPCKNLYT
jgi:hypothetical protein